ncbi:MAG: hypothetical protein ACYDAK_13970 [Candidatus Limnocylindrales bacterium]
MPSEPRDPERKLTREEQLKETETELLEMLYRAYPRKVNTDVDHDLRDFHGRVGNAADGTTNQYGERLFDEARLNLQRQNLIEAEPGHGYWRLAILPEGIREFGRRRSAIQWGDNSTLNRIITEQVATLAEFIEANRKEQEGLSKKLTSFDDKLVRVERSFYSQIYPLFAVFVAAFALILTAAQVVVRSPSPTAADTFWQSSATLGPVTIAVLLLILVAWLLGKWH